MAGVIQAAVNIQEKSARSVFVGNIPFEATEEQLKEMFSQVGPVLNFRMVHDRETGKPKGYGFIEYQDIETAQSAMRNLNSLEFNGRPLRVGAAQGEAKEELKAILGGPVVESPYGEPVATEKAPEAISKAVASLPPEQMFELMKQMKMCIQNNPNEARTMLLQNPQLAYALLQAQIVMKIVDPQVAMAMLHRKEDEIPPIQPGTSQQTQQKTVTLPLMDTLSPQQNQNTGPGPSLLGSGPRGMSLPGGPGGMMSGGLGVRMPGQGPPGGANMPPGPRMMQSSMRGDFGGFEEFEGIPGGPAGLAHGTPPSRGGMRSDRSNRQMGGPPPAPGPRGPGGDLRNRGLMGPGGPRGGPEPMGMEPQGSSDPRGMRGPPRLTGPPSAADGAGPSAPGGPVSSQDQEKAALIMQVLQLSDAQIALLPPDQRESIMILKQQIAGGQK